ncbi:MAG: AAA family ATPase [Sharpea porci]|uniref:AAA family ATPase n=1 Tax=Sharpea porci TaxID=2652286 RepID=UPI002409A1FA|nr:AAA family ATPase [Sharpea porci]MDD6710761.1 AAA family ATPase [Sharpea porci]
MDDYNKKILSSILEDVNQLRDSLQKIESDKKADSIDNTLTEIGYNKIYYGIPGCGKSYYVDNTVLDGVDKVNNVFRTTFYLDYSNSDFIGQIYPVIKDDGKVTYEPIPGPFTKALERALTNKNEMIYLVIEEINRGNAAAIFGDVFQLLDRLKEDRNGRVVGDSEYPISNVFIEDYLKKQGVNYTPGNIYIPHNLTILATMNTSDQNVFPLDTAFKRRWGREKITNNWAEVGEIKNMYVPYTDVTWETFATIINKEMVSISARNDAPISEDKQMGAYFANETMLTKEPNSKDEEKIDNFANNVLDYLFTDVTKFDHKVLFEEHIYTSDDVYNRVEAYKNNLIGKTDGVDSDNTTSQSIFTEIFSKDISSELIENAKVVDEDNG